MKVAVVSGSSSGMGRATTLLLVKSGFAVFALTRDVSKFDKTANITPVLCDIKKQTSIDLAIAKVINEHGKIDLLVNNAGFGLVSAVEHFNEDEMFEQFNINVFAVLRLTKAVLPHMRSQKSGVIINISSFLGKISLPLLTLYNSSKYALEGITDSLRYELKDFGIRVHSIMPGFFNTEFARSNLVVNAPTMESFSPYHQLVTHLAPILIEQINGGNSADEVASLVLEIFNTPSFLARATVGDKAKKFIPMRRELSDEEFERRIVEYWEL